LAWDRLQLFGISTNLRVRAVQWITAAFAAMTIFGLLQTFSGRSRFDIGISGAAVIVIAGLGLMAHVLHVLLKQRRAFEA